VDTTALTARVDQLVARLRDTRHCDVLDPCDDCKHKHAELDHQVAMCELAKAVVEATSHLTIVKIAGLGGISRPTIYNILDNGEN
jgi:hypothetical protein